jgi:hypothetical protein
MQGAGSSQYPHFIANIRTSCAEINGGGLASAIYLTARAKYGNSTSAYGYIALPRCRDAAGQLQAMDSYQNLQKPVIHFGLTTMGNYLSHCSASMFTVRCPFQ